MKRQNFQSNRHTTKQAFKPSFAHSVADNSFLSIEELSAITRLPKAEIVGLHLAGLVPGFKSFVDEGLYFFTPDAPQVLIKNLNSMGSKSGTWEATSTTQPLSTVSEVDEKQSSASIIDVCEADNEEDNISQQTITPLQGQNLIAYDDKPKQSLELSRPHFLNIAIKKTAEYCQTVNNYKTSVLLTGVRHQLTSENLDYIPDYVGIMNLDIKLVKASDLSSGYRLDLRNRDTAIKKIRQVMCKDRIRLKGNSLITATKDANIKIHQQCEESCIELIPLKKADCLSQALRISNKVNRVSQNKTIDDMESYLLFWQFIAGEVPLHFIDSDFVLDVVAKLIEEEKSHSTIHHFCCELRKALDLAVVRGWITHIPSIPSFQSDPRHYYDIPLSKFKIFRDSYTHLLGGDIHQKLVDKVHITLLRYTGQRLTNVSETLVQDIDLIKRLRHINKDDAKPGVAIDIPLSRKAMAAIRLLLWHRKKMGITHPKLLAYDNSGKSPKINNKIWGQALQEAELEPDIVRHHFRHYFITSIIREGFGYVEAKIAGGFKSMQALLRYVHCGASKETFAAVNSIE